MSQAKTIFDKTELFLKIISSFTKKNDWKQLSLCVRKLLECALHWKGHHTTDYCLSLTQDSQSESLSQSILKKDLPYIIQFQSAFLISIFIIWKPIFLSCHFSGIGNILIRKVETYLSEKKIAVRLIKNKTFFSEKQTADDFVILQNSTYQGEHCRLSCCLPHIVPHQSTLLILINFSPGLSKFLTWSFYILAKIIKENQI